MKNLKKTALIVSAALCLGMAATAASAGCHRGGCYNHPYYNNGYYIYQPAPYFYDNYYDYGTPGLYLNFGGGYYHYRY